MKSIDTNIFSSKFPLFLAFVLFCTYTGYMLFYYTTSFHLGRYRVYKFNSTKSTENVSIVFWISPGPENIPLPNQLHRLNRTVMRWNRKTGNSCQNFQYSTSICRFSLDPNSVSTADAVIFHMFTYGYRINELPKFRSANQLWVMYAREAPPKSLWFDELEDIINWTISYRRDSDIWAPYGNAILKSTAQLSLPTNFVKFLNGKTKLAVAVISNCKTASGREELISNLISEGLQIDILGACGNESSCGRHKKNCTDFWNELASQYKFYLAFENSLCEDYITEKFWRSLELGMVPVVYGGGNYTRDIPMQSYINVEDFVNLKDLASYLKYLDENATVYKRYFDWKREYEVNRFDDEVWCKLCKQVLMHKSGKGKIRKSYSNLKSWWDHKAGSNSINACKFKPSRLFEIST